MTKVHLYFLKIFGCAISQYNVPIEIEKFSYAIRKNKTHPNVYLVFGPKPKIFTKKIAMLSDMDVYSDEKGCLFASFFLFLEKVTVGILYSREGYVTEGTVKGWHPRQTKNLLRMINVDPDTQDDGN